jgi:hypothetical protein
MWSKTLQEPQNQEGTPTGHAAPMRAFLRRFKRADGVGAASGQSPEEATRGLWRVIFEVLVYMDG